MVHPWAKYDENPPRGSWDFVLTRFSYGRTDGRTTQKHNASGALRGGGIKMLCCPLSRPTVKCEKTGSGFFFFFFFYVRFGRRKFAKICIQRLKKALAWLVYMRFDCIPPEFSPFRNFKKNIGKLNSLTVRKKKKKKKNPDRPTQFSIFGRVRAT